MIFIKIFREREIDYFTMQTDEEVVDKTIQLLRENKHDFILSYIQDFDEIRQFCIIDPNGSLQ